MASKEAETELDAFNRKTLEVAESPRRRQNQFARRNPKLQAMLDRAEESDRDHTRADIQQVSGILLQNVIGKAMEDPEAVDEKKSAELLSFLRGEEMHQAKIDKLKADTESVLINVATPTALRNMVNEIGMCIQRGNEKAVLAALEVAAEDEDAGELIRQIGGDIHIAIMQEIAKMGYEDNSLTRALAAPR